MYVHSHVFNKLETKQQQQQKILNQNKISVSEVQAVAFRNLDPARGGGGGGSTLMVGVETPIHGCITFAALMGKRFSLFLGHCLHQYSNKLQASIHKSMMLLHVM